MTPTPVPKCEGCQLPVLGTEFGRYFAFEWYDRAGKRHAETLCQPCFFARMKAAHAAAPESE